MINMIKMENMMNINTVNMKKKQKYVVERRQTK